MSLALWIGRVRFLRQNYLPIFIAVVTTVNDNIKTFDENWQSFNSGTLLHSFVQFRKSLETYLTDNEKVEQMNTRHQAITKGHLQYIALKPA